MGNSGIKSDSETHLQAFLKSSHNKIKRNDDVDLVEAYQSMIHGKLETRSKKALDMLWCKNHLRVCGPHVLCVHCDTIVCDCSKRNTVSRTGVQSKSKHHFEHCTFAKLEIKLTHEEQCAHDDCKRNAFFREHIVWLNKKKIMTEWHNNLKHVKVSNRHCNECMEGTCEMCGSSKKEGAVMTIDRINSFWFYTDDNAQGLCHTCNKIKRDWSQKFINRHVKKIAEHQKTKDDSH